MNKHFSCLSILCALGAASAATAQVGSQTAGNQGGTLEEVVVTAQRRSENLQDVPISVTAVSAEQLSAAAIRSTQDLTTLVSGLTFPSTFGTALPHIRGVGTTAVAPGVENSVALYVDGVYYATAGGSILSLNNVAQIEVLKGPQGTLFGRNATGGLIQITTQDPTADLHGNADVTYGNYKTTSVEGYVSGGPSDRYAIDLSVQATHQGDGYGTNLYNGDQVYQTDHDISVRSKQLWKPADGTTVRISLDYEDTRSSQGALSNADGYANANVYYAATPHLITTPDFDVNLDLQPLTTVRSGGASATLDQDLGFAHFISISAYRDEHYYFGLDSDFGPMPFETVTNAQEDTQITQEFQLQSPKGNALQWTAGLFYLHADDAENPDVVNFSPITGPVLPFAGGAFALTQVVTNTTQVSKSYAAYGQTSYEILPRTNLTLGARITDESKTLSGTVNNFATNRFNNQIVIPLTPYDGVYNSHTSTNTPSWRVGLDHKFSDEVLGYISYNRGFKSGGFNLGNPSTPAYLPEKLDAYELGLKTSSLDDHLRVNVAGFYYNYDNIQVSQFVSGAPEVYNGARARIYGGDLDLQALVTQALSFTLGVEALHADFTSFPCADYFLTGANSPSCPPPTPPTFSRSATGNELPDTPTLSANVSANYRVAMFDGESDFEVAYALNSGYYSDPNNELHQKAFGIVNASWRWNPTGNRFFVRLWGKNLTNATYTYELATSADDFGQALAPPRTYGVTAGFKF